MSSTYPLDMVRGRLTVQSDHGRYRGIAHAAVTIMREEGPLALYKGWLPSVIGVVPYVGLNFAVYETLKARRSSPGAARDVRRGYGRRFAILPGGSRPLLTRNRSSVRRMLCSSTRA